MADYSQADPSLLIDLNRGVTKRINPAGVHVFMYKDSPGVYLDWDGKEVDPAMAKSAGFDIDTLARRKAQADKIREATEAINKEFSDDMEPYRSGDMQVIKGVDSGYRIADLEGVYLSDSDVPFATAKKILDEMSVKKNKPSEQTKNQKNQSNGKKSN